MSEKRDVIKELKEFKNTFELKEEDTIKAKQLATELYSKTDIKSINHSSESSVLSKTRKYKIIMIMGAFFIAILFLGCFLPIILKDAGENKIKYYDVDQIELSEIKNIDEFFIENKLNNKYYRGNSVSENFFAGYVKENGTLVYIRQRCLVLNSLGFDTFELNICLTKDKFHSFDVYDYYTNSLSVNNVLVQYKIENQSTMDVIYATFEYESMKYHVRIETKESESKLEQYIQDILQKKEP